MYRIVSPLYFKLLQFICIIVTVKTPHNKVQKGILDAVYSDIFVFHFNLQETGAIYVLRRI